MPTPTLPGKNACLLADRDPLFLGVFNVVSCCVLRLFGRIYTGANNRTTLGTSVCRITI